MSNENNEDRSITHDPKAEVDLTANTMVASQRVKAVIHDALAKAVNELFTQGLPEHNDMLQWQLIGDPLLRWYQRLEKAAFPEGEKKEDIPSIEAHERRHSIPADLFDDTTES